jgi:hypothetical protein
LPFFIAASSNKCNLKPHCGVAASIASASIFAELCWLCLEAQAHFHAAAPAAIVNMIPRDSLPLLQSCHRECLSRSNRD